jgi:SlyX protein
MENHTQTDERIANLELKILRQDDLMDTLNSTVYRQQKKIDELEALCTAFARGLRELRDTASDRLPGHDKPPHY